MPADSPTNDQAIEALRVRRAELSESMSALEQALAAPAPGRRDAWAQRVHVALVELVSDFREHIAIAEGPDGLYRGVLSTTPRLADAVARLTRDHAEINDLIDQLLTRVGAAPVNNDAVDAVRDLGTALLVRLIRSRQRSADLIYQAYQSDIGGEA
jgi:Hemerythrin HHE cation binding domain